MLAHFTGVMRLQLDRTESDKLAEALADLSQYYDMPAVAPETLAWVNLAQVLAFIYGTRIVAARMDAKAARAKRDEPATAENSRGSATPDPNPPRPPVVKENIPSFTTQTIDGLGTIEVPTHP